MNAAAEDGVNVNGKPTDNIRESTENNIKKALNEHYIHLKDNTVVGESQFKRINKLVNNFKDKNGDINWNSIVKSSDFEDLMTDGWGITDTEIRGALTQYAGLSENANEWDDWVAKTIYDEMYKKFGKNIKDGLLSSNDSSMLTTASNVTPIHDGSVQLAKSDPKDSAIFAKTGGPFDTLFNGIFAKINEVSEILPKSMSYNMPIDIRKSLSESLSHSKDTTNNPNIQINPIKIELNGKLELTNSNGQSVDIINTIKNNPMLLRQLSELISQSINENIYGGKSTFNAGVTTTRFKPL